VDDDRFVLDAITSYLSSDSELEVAATASNGIEALEVLAQTPCDVVVSDVEMPHMDGRQLLTEVRKLSEPPAFVTMTAFLQMKLWLKCSPMVQLHTLSRATVPRTFAISSASLCPVAPRFPR